MSAPVDAYVGVGSNLGDRRRAIWSGICSLDRSPGVSLTAMSSIVETEAVVLAGQAAQHRYLNAAVRIATTLGPRALVERCLEIEAELGRDRTSEERWGARPLDLDVLIHGTAVLDEPGLQIPHPRMHERWFVLAPLAEIAAGVIHPVMRRSIESLRDDVERRSS